MKQLTLGLLETGLVDDELREHHGSFPDMFENLFNAQGKAIKYKRYNVIDGHYPEHIDDCDGYLITGSRSDSFDNLPWINTLKDYIRTLYDNKKKMVGICFGHQLIAHTLGGQAQRFDGGWGVGVHRSEITLNDRPAWLTDISNFNLLVTHRDQVVSLPDNATLLASNDFCRHSAFFIDDIALCFQGHPEFSVGFAKGLMASRQAMIGEPTYSNALASFDQPIDDDKIARMILDFIAFRAC